MPKNINKQDWKKISTLESMKKVLAQNASADKNIHKLTAQIANKLQTMTTQAY